MGMGVSFGEADTVEDAVICQKIAAKIKKRTVFMEMCTKDQPKEYIERGAAINAISGQPSELHYPSWYKGNIEGVPAADVAPVVHGEWEIKARIYRMMDDIDEVLYIECPICKREFRVPSTYDDEEIIKYAREHYPYCNCGVKMDGGKR